MMDDTQTIAAGGEPLWQETFEHPEYGPLTFVVERTPKAVDWLAHAVAQDRLAPGLSEFVGVGPQMLAAAIAGIQTMIKPPVVKEVRHVDPDNEHHVTIERVLYDPLEEEHIDFLVEVWTKFIAFRAGMLDKVAEVKNSSGATSGADTADASPDTTDSPPES